jgi:hypothetical protein
MVRAGVAHLPNVTVHEGSQYIISRATFPAYFLKETGKVQQAWSEIDVLIFRDYIAPALGITHRFIGSEPFCDITRQYNQTLHACFPRILRWWKCRASRPPATPFRPRKCAVYSRHSSFPGSGRLSRTPPSRISKRITVRVRKSHNYQEFIMKIVREALAGTQESSDLMVKIAPLTASWRLSSTVK